MVRPHDAGRPRLHHRLFRWGLALASLRVVSLAAAVLLAEWWFVPESLPGPTVIAARLTTRCPPPWPNGPVAKVFLVRDAADSWRAVDDDMSGDALAALVSQPPGRVLVADLAHQRRVVGLWGPWLLREASLVDIRPLSGGKVPASDAALARAVFADWFKRRGSATYASLVARGGVESTTLVWWGPLADLAAVGAIGMIVLGMIRLALTLKAQERMRRSEAGLCPNCRYDLRGAVADEKGLRTCPECGFASAPTRPI
ncbi:MAG: hypothetical protein DYG92_14230 [Leptolyngbya sp. PLA1]|nr:hypothetical protein [Leptolyngbya sp. PLA1]